MNFELLKMKAIHAFKMSEPTYSEFLPSAILIQFYQPKHFSKFRFAYCPAFHSLSSKWSHVFQFPDCKLICFYDISNYNNKYITLCR